MKVEIWSDVMCPFCYIGKRKFETALSQFHGQKDIEVEWKSFQLMPDLEKGKVSDLEQLLVEKKGISQAQAQSMNAHVANVGQQVGLVFNFDKAQAVNTEDAHRFLHFAKASGKQNEAEEVLFRSYFTDGKNIGDLPTLLEIGKEIGLDTEQLKPVLENGSFSDDVRKDIYEAQQIGVSGVPFFVLNRKYGVSGAQDPVVFLQVLEKAFGEWREENPGLSLEVSEGDSCGIDGVCD